MSDNQQNYIGQIATGVFLGGAGLLLTWFVALPVIGILLWVAVFMLASTPDWVWPTVLGAANLVLWLVVINAIIDSCKQKKAKKKAVANDSEFQNNVDNWNKQRKNFIKSWNK